MIQRSATGPIDELAGTLTNLDNRTQTLEIIAHRHRFNLDPTAWTPVPFNPGWADAGVFALQVCQYRMVGDVVQLRGTATVVAPPAAIPGVIFTLPVGFRPPANLVLPVISGGALGTLLINFLGQVTAFAGAGPDFNITSSFSVTP